jgi:predicted NUDIX family NTP pyrophosphohydrolase
MPKRSAGILMYRRGAQGLDILLVHPGGPFWARKDLGAWSIPKGEYSEGDEALATAIREFAEETGTHPRGKFRSLGELTQPGRKIITATFPEVDRAEWFSLETARAKILSGQREFITRLLEMV